MPSLLALALSFQMPASGLPPNAALDRPLAVEARIEPLPDLLARIGKDLGVPLTVERRMEGLKATVFTKDRPARVTLAGLASVFEAEWVPVKEGGYRLAEVIPARGRRELYLKREEDLRRARAEATLTRRVEIPEFVPTGDAEKDEEGRESIEYETRQVPTERLIVAAYKGLTPAERERFWRGELVHVIGRSEGQPEERIRTKGENGMGDSLSITPHPAGTNLTLIRYAPGSVGLQTMVFSPDGSNSLRSGGGLPGPDDPALADHPFRRAQTEWATDLSISKAPEWELPLKPVPTVPLRWAKDAITSSDVLEEVYRRSGVPIVAEANRRVIGLLNGEGGTTWGTTLGKELQLGILGRDAFRLEAGTLLSRPSGFWQSRLIEPPEAVLAPFERETAPSLDTLATMCARLSPATLAQLFRVFPNIATIHDPDPKRARDLFSRPKWSLWLWGRLAPTLRTRLARGEVIPLAALPAEARDAVREVTVNAVLDGVRVDSPLPEIEVPSDETVETVSMTIPMPVAPTIDLLGYGSGGEYALSAIVIEDKDAPGTFLLSIKIADDHGNSLQLPEAGTASRPPNVATGSSHLGGGR